MATKVAIYVRVSTQEQAQEGYSIDAQTERLQAYCRAKDWTVFGVYTDAGYSGSNTKRPDLQRLLTDVRAGLVDCVLVYKLDRLSRSQKDTLMLIEDTFLAAGVAFVSMSENFDTSTPLGRAMVGILSVFAQLEREQIRERMAMGRAERARQGLYHGGGWKPFGYDYVDGRLVVNPIEAEAVKDTYRLFLDEHATFYEISKYIETHYGRSIDHAGVRSILDTPIYIGEISWEGKTYPGQHDAIVDRETFDRAQVLLADRWRIAASKPAPFHPKYLLSGLLVCGSCGNTYITRSAYSGKKPNRKYRPYYSCYSRAKIRGSKVLDINCRNPNYSCSTLDEMVIAEVLRLAENSDAFAEACNTPPVGAQDALSAAQKREAVQLRLDELDGQIRRVLDLYQLGSIDIDEIKGRLSDLEKERDALLATLKEKKRATVVKLKPATAHTLLHEFSALVGSGDTEAMRDVLHELIARIVLHPTPGDVEIVWNF
ncbi:MAG: recombinase family protein [Selenomonas sp.]|nr:recombinase family protein [Selenomonas sp.]